MMLLSYEELCTRVRYLEMFKGTQIPEKYLSKAR